MTHVLFKQQDQGLSCALAAVRLLKRLAEYSDSEAQREIYLANATKYEELAKGILDRCFEYSKYDVIRLLLRKVPLWGNVTMITLTIAAGSRLLKTHPAVQMVTSCAWRGALASSTTWTQVYAALFCPLVLFSPNFIQFNYSEDVVLGDIQSVMFTSVLAELHELKQTKPEVSNQSSRKISTVKFNQQTNIEMKSNGRKSSKFSIDDEIGDAADLLMIDGDEDDEIDEDEALLSKSELKNAPVFWRFYLFYSSPQVIFTTNTISFSIFLFLFGFVLLFDFNLRPSGLEWFLLFWIFTFICEEIRQIIEVNVPITSKKRFSRWHHIKIAVGEWISDTWNWVDSAGITFFLVGYFLRFAVKEELDQCDPYVVYHNCKHNSTACLIECDSAEVNTVFYYSHVIYCCSFICYSIRLLHVFQMSKNLGPKLVMIRKMIADICYLMAVLAVFMLWYGVVSQALLYPNHNDPYFQLRRLMRRAYMHIYGELFLEEVANVPDVSEFECTLNPAETEADNIPRCPIPDVGIHFPFVPLFTSAYMIIANVLLLNLLVNHSKCLVILESSIVL